MAQINHNPSIPIPSPNATNNHTLYYTIRSPWSWVLKRLSQALDGDNNLIGKKCTRMVEVSSPSDLPSAKNRTRQQQQRQQPKLPSTTNQKTIRHKRKLPPRPCTLRLELVPNNNVGEGGTADATDCNDVVYAAHGTSEALDGCEDKDELVRTLLRSESFHGDNDQSQCTTGAVCPISLLLEWDIAREECWRSVARHFPFLCRRIDGDNNADGSKTVAVLKAPLGSRGDGIYFVTSFTDLYNIIDDNRARALQQPPAFLETLRQRKGRIPSWVLQAEIHPPMLLRRRKFHLRTYVAILERAVASSASPETTDLPKTLDIYVYNRHEVRVASFPIDDTDERGDGYDDGDGDGTPHEPPNGTVRDRRAHITNGAGGDETERLLLHHIDEFHGSNLRQRLERFVAETFVHTLCGSGLSSRATGDDGFVNERAKVEDEFSSRNSTDITKTHLFCIAGVDVMVDAGGTFHLLEVNVNPAAPPEDVVKGSDFEEHLVGFMRDLINLLFEGGRALGESGNFSLAQGLIE